MASYFTPKSYNDSYLKSCNNNRTSSDFNDTKMQANYSVDRLIYDLKIILVGNSGVGKTSLLGRFLGNDFSTNYKCTVTVETSKKNLSLDVNTGVNLNIWDTCGQEKFRSMTKSYFREAHGILLVYDVSDRKSFDDLGLWLKEIKNSAPENSSILLVGNKIDLPRVISNEEGNEFAIKNKIQYVETSCYEGSFIETPFVNLSIDIINKINKGEIKIENGKKENDEDKDIDIKINDNDKLELEMKNINKKERKREKDIKCCF